VCHVGTVCESLIDESPARNMLRSRLVVGLIALKFFKGLASSMLPQFPELYHSAMMVGDVESAMMCRFAWWLVEFWTAAVDLISVSNHIVRFIKDATKYQYQTFIYGSMPFLNLCSYLLERDNTEIDVISFDDIDAIGERVKSVILIFHNFISRLALHFWTRNYKQVAYLSRTHSEKYPSVQQNRILNSCRVFYEGIAYLNLARDTKQFKWMVLGKEAVTRISKIAAVSKWNFEHKSNLLQAELHYLEGNLGSAEMAYKASIRNAHENKFTSEEALAHELYGYFCVENHMADKGLEQLDAALGMYRQWGAMKKVTELQAFVEMMNLCHL